MRTRSPRETAPAPMPIEAAQFSGYRQNGYAQRAGDSPSSPPATERRDALDGRHIIHREINLSPYRAMRQPIVESSRSRFIADTIRFTQAAGGVARTVAIKIGHDFRAASYRAGADELRGRAAKQSGEGARAHRGGGRARRQDRMPPGAVSLAVFLPGPRRIAASISPSRFPVRPPRSWARSRRRARSSSSRRCSRSAPRASTTTPRSSSMRTGKSPASIARCISPTIRATTKSFISRPATSISSRIRPRSGRWACWYAGISGFPRRRG